ncbi:helix-turn-helix domain-containing protein [Lentilitoribacter sp. EG35]|uniref:helix-turn-helix domain-containing protein n=1 Tax=Lentilitoribacter sp. EG35 TaxID=3234192 RepID=UPI00345F48CE
MRDLQTAREVFALFLSAQMIKRRWSANRVAKKLDIKASSINAVKNRKRCAASALDKLLDFSKITGTWAEPVIKEKDARHASI